MEIKNLGNMSINIPPGHHLKLIYVNVLQTLESYTRPRAESLNLKRLNNHNKPCLSHQG